MTTFIIFDSSTGFSLLYLIIGNDGDSPVLHHSLVQIHDPSHLKHGNNNVEPMKCKPVKKIADEKQDGHLREVEESERIAVSLPSHLNDKDGYWPVSDFDSSGPCQDMTKGKDNEMYEDTEKDSMGETELLKSDLDIFTDKSVTEFELPEVEVRGKDDSEYHEIRDICMDKGVISDAKILFEMNGDSGHEGILLPNEEADSRQVKEKAGNDNLISDVFEVPEEQWSADPVGKCSPEHLIHSAEDVQRECLTTRGDKDEQQSAEVPHDESISGSSAPFHATEEPEKSSEEAAKDSNIISATPSLTGDCKVESGSNEEEATSEAKEVPFSSQVESGTITFSFAASTPTPSNRYESLSRGNNEFPNNQDRPKVNESHAYFGRDQQSYGESSFSILAGPPSGLISNSGPIAYSGSLSLRSDSSTTSTRSFAFPV
ncbi:hypothetical protein CDL15_Pgr009512 [Punica granatum]|uniref:Uncharacterized protein n=1 Tax=Punica granatum TaxID=22663 RepID=A0A218WTM3_PUNGR|nr:hypothetical protein CDL15_Pgr009512 [Punica granatum]